MVDKVVSGGQGGQWWTRWSVVDKVVSGGPGGQWWTRWSVVDKVVSGGQGGQWPTLPVSTQAKQVITPNWS